ncbi:hypothetical protein STEG23_027147 [Scotinomys teguina]
MRYYYTNGIILIRLKEEGVAEMTESRTYSGVWQIDPLILLGSLLFSEGKTEEEWIWGRGESCEKAERRLAVSHQHYSLYPEPGNNLDVPQLKNGLRKCGTYTMEYYSAEKNNNTMKFAGKWKELENIILSEVTQTQKDKHGSQASSGIRGILVLLGILVEKPQRNGEGNYRGEQTFCLSDTDYQASIEILLTA